MRLVHPPRQRRHAMKQDYTHITVILDRSGSMESIRDDTTGGFNAFLEEQKAEPGQATLTLVQFDAQDSVRSDPRVQADHGNPDSRSRDLRSAWRDAAAGCARTGHQRSGAEHRQARRGRAAREGRLRHRDRRPGEREHRVHEGTDRADDQAEDRERRVAVRLPQQRTRSHRGGEGPGRRGRQGLDVPQVREGHFGVLGRAFQSAAEYRSGRKRQIGFGQAERDRASAPDPKKP